MVRVYEGGRNTFDLCLQPSDYILPVADLVLMHVLLLEAAEETYLQVAHRWVPLGGSRPAARVIQAGDALGVLRESVASEDDAIEDAEPPQWSRPRDPRDLQEFNWGSLGEEVI
jgi:hypothetical protein